jgi:hypothetical protein
MKKPLTIIAVTLILFFSGFLIAKLTTKKPPPQPEQIDVSSLINKIHSDSIIIAGLGAKKDSIYTIYVLKKEFVKTHVNSLKTHDQITTYLNDVLRDSTAVYFSDSNYTIKGIYGNALYNAFFEAFSYKELNELCEMQLNLIDSAFAICLNDVDSLVSSIYEAKRINEGLMMDNRIKDGRIEKLEKKVKNRNRIIIGLVSILGIENTIIFAK